MSRTTVLSFLFSQELLAQGRHSWTLRIPLQRIFLSLPVDMSFRYGILPLPSLFFFVFAVELADCMEIFKLRIPKFLSVIFLGAFSFIFLNLSLLVFQGPQTQRVRNSLSRRAYNWLSRHKIRAFYSIVEANNLEEGSRNLFQVHHMDSLLILAN